MCCYIHPSPQSPRSPGADSLYTYLQVYVKCISSDIIKLKSDDHKLKEGTKVLELNKELKSTQAKITDKKKIPRYWGGVAIFWINQWKALEGEDWTIKENFTNQGLHSWSLTLEQESEMFTNQPLSILSLTWFLETFLSVMWVRGPRPILTGSPSGRSMAGWDLSLDISWQKDSSWTPAIYQGSKYKTLRTYAEDYGVIIWRVHVVCRLLTHRSPNCTIKSLS